MAKTFIVPYLVSDCDTIIPKTFVVNTAKGPTEALFIATSMIDNLYKKELPIYTMEQQGLIETQDYILINDNEIKEL